MPSTRRPLKSCPLSGNCDHWWIFEPDGAVENDPFQPRRRATGVTVTCSIGVPFHAAVQASRLSELAVASCLKRGRLPSAASVIAARLLSVGFDSEGTAFGILFYVRLDVLSIR